MLVAQAFEQRQAQGLARAFVLPGSVFHRAVAPSTPAVELYSLVLAGDGKQSVFKREAEYVNNMLASRFGSRGQISLINHRDHLMDRPMATRENLYRAAKTLAERTGPEDLVFIYLTSHGTAEHQLVLEQPRMELADLAADELAEESLQQPRFDEHNRLHCLTDRAGFQRPAVWPSASIKRVEVHG